MKKLLIGILFLFIMNCGSELDPDAQANKKKEKEENAKTKGLLIALYCESTIKYDDYSNTKRPVAYNSCMNIAAKAYLGLD